MELKHNITFNVATAFSGSSKVWKNKKYTWDEFLERISEPTVTKETYAQFMKASKQDQGKIKDVGGYIGATLLNGSRKKSAVQNKQLITLDIDFSYTDFWWDFTILYDCAACIHSTHKSSPKKPRHRLIIPLDREVSADEYEPIARKIAGDLNIDLFDQSTFQTNRLMYWPSVSCDVDYYFEYQDGPILSADAILDSYNDWHDISEWPISSEFDKSILSTVKKQEDPCTKKGIIGVFCRAYTIQEAIEAFLPDVYEKVSDDRYTYIKGSTAGGLLIYDDKFAYSHHGTDPIGGRLCNAFDLIRIHKFGDKDTGNEPDDKHKKSFKLMEELITNDKRTKKELANEKFAQAKLDFENPVEFDKDADTSWTEELKATTKGEYENSSQNINLILKNDQILKNAFTLNLFDNRRYILKDMPWRKLEVKPDYMKDVDYSGIRNYIECVYGISSSLKVDDSLAIEVQRKSFHPIREYISSITWDGVKRIDTLLIDYFGAEDNSYTRAAIRKALCAAVTRVFKPGTKYDMVLILVGPQGTYKSTFIRKLGMNWFSDTFTTVQGKEAYEQLQGAWIIEMAELSAFKKSEAESIKQFISKCDDAFRPAYGRTVEIYKRQCIFFGTTNDTDFLKDPTGNRRFNPIDIHPENATKSVPNDLTQDEIDQIWAEAYQLYKNGEKLYFEDNEVSMLAKTEQAKHSSTDERLGVVIEYVNKLLPDDWDKKDLYDRRTWLDDPLAKNGTIQRDTVCIAEIWCECLGKDKKDMTRYNTRELNDLMKSQPDWEFVTSTKHFSIYGKQKYFKRKDSLL